MLLRKTASLLSALALPGSPRTRSSGFAGEVLALGVSGIFGLAALRKSAHGAPALNVARDPWTDLDPSPAIFDTELAAVDPRNVEAHVGNPDAKLEIVIDAEDEDVARLQRARFGRAARGRDIAIA